MKRNVIVTGGTRGIGREIARLFHTHGDRVAAIYGHNQAAAQAFEQETGIPTFQCNVASFDSCQNTIQAIQETWGATTQILVNNAGITSDSTLHKMATEQWDKVIQTNLSSAFYMCKTVIEGMRAEKYGRIINVSSVNALKGQVGQANYAASKAGLIGLTKSLALETAHLGITVNAVTPGYTDTEMVRAVPEKILENIIASIPVKRLGTAQEIASLIHFLASDEASYITGSVLNINGGLRM